MIQKLIQFCLLSFSSSSFLPTGPVLPANQLLLADQDLPGNEVLPDNQILPESEESQEQRLSGGPTGPYDSSYSGVPRADSYAGIDSYGVPVGEPLTAPQDYYFSGYGVPSAPVVTEPPPVTEPPALNYTVLILCSFLLVMFLWPVTVTVEASDMRIRTEQIMQELTEPTTTIMQEATLIPSTTSFTTMSRSGTCITIVPHTLHYLLT